VALLRYAVDLLGVVFVITLVGFALRTLSDWLTEGESVSGWAMSAVSFSLIGTVLVGVWLFNSGGRRELTLPGPVERSVGWLERRGWGQRVLLPGGSFPAPAPASPRVSGGSGSAPAPPPSAPVAAAPIAAAPAPASRAVSSAGAPRTRAPGGPEPGGAGSARGRAASSESVPADAQHAAAESGTAPDVEAVPAAPATTLSLTVSPDSPVVGQSVRLTARLSAPDDSTPAGTVAFYDGARLLGRAPLRRVGDGWEAFLVTLRLG